jgi:hypothetical protein
MILQERPSEMKGVLSLSCEKKMGSYSQGDLGAGHFLRD